SSFTMCYELHELYCLILLLIQADEPDPQFPQATDEQLSQLNHLKSSVFSIFDAAKTEYVIKIVEKIVVQLNQDYRDSINEYFIFPIASINDYTRNSLFDELTRTDPLTNDDLEEVDKEKNEYKIGRAHV